MSTIEIKHNVVFSESELDRVHEHLTDLQQRIDGAEREASEAADQASEAASSLQYVEHELKAVRFFLLNRDPEKRGPVSFFTNAVDGNDGLDFTGDPDVDVEELAHARSVESYGLDAA